MDAMEQYKRIKIKSIFNCKMRDDTGSSYDIFIYAEDGKRKKVCGDIGEVWAGVSDGEEIYKGHLIVVYKREDSVDIAKYILGDNQLMTVNLSRKLIKVVNNNFDNKRDFLAISEVQGSDISSIQLFQIRNGQMECVEFKEYEKTYNFILTYGCRESFIKQVAENNFEIAQYSPMDGKFHLYTYELVNEYMFEQVDKRYDMTKEEFDKYQNESDKSTS